MKQLLFLIGLIVYSTSVSGGYFLAPTWLEKPNSGLGITFVNYIEWRGSTERLANDHDYYGEMSGEQFTAQLCGSSAVWCVGFKNERHSIDLELAHDTESLTYDSITQSERVYLQRALNNAFVGGGVGVGLSEEGDVSSNIDFQFGNTASLSLFYGQNSLDVEMASHGSINDVSKTFSSTREEILNNIGGSFAYDWASGQVAATVQQSWSENRYRNNRVELSAQVFDNWLLYAAQHDISNGDALSSAGDQVNDLDDWLVENTLSRYTVGYLMPRNWVIGVRGEAFKLSSSADVQCSNKNWGLSGVEKTLACLFVAPYAAFDGRLGYEYRGAEAQKTFLFDRSTLRISNGIGIADWHAELHTQADTSSSDYHSGKEWLWVPSIAWRYTYDRWAVQYDWRQIVPMQAFKTLFNKSGDKSPTSNSNAEETSGEENTHDLSRDWHWPQVGGYHQLTLSYQW